MEEDGAFGTRFASFGERYFVFLFCLVTYGRSGVAN